MLPLPKKDKATQDFLWGNFVREQVEEEATADGIVDMIKKAGDAGIFFVDSKSGRTQIREKLKKFRAAY